MFIDLDYTKEVPKPKLFLAKPNGNIISPINDIEPELKIFLNTPDEISFKIPLFIEEDSNSSINNFPKLIKNPLIEQIKDRYLILVKFMKKAQWFIIMQIKPNSSSAENDNIEVKGFSLEYELKDKKINFSTQSSTIRQILNGNYLDKIPHGALNNTKWSIGYIDPYYEDVYREFSYTGDKLQLLQSLTEKFDAVIKYNTEDRIIDIYYKYNFGKNSNIVFDYRKYLKSVSKDQDADSSVMCTRLQCFGKDNMSIENVNPTGKNYIDDFSYFMHPFTIENGIVTKHSDYGMSDNLCIAITKYKAKIMQYRDTFKELIMTKNTYNKLMLYKEKELRDLKHELEVFKDKYSVAMMSGNSIQPIITIKKEIEQNIKNKDNEIKEYRNKLKEVEDRIYDIRIDLEEENNFTNTELDELDNYIIEDKWEAPDYIDDEDLYRDGKKKLKEKSKPKVILTIDYIDFLKCIDEQNMWEHLNVGDKIGVQYPLLNIDEKIQYGENTFVVEDEV